MRTLDPTHPVALLLGLSLLYGCTAGGGQGTDAEVDASFPAAVARGVQPHHWDFGPMPPIPSLSPDEVADITAHVRQLQAEAGLIEDPAG